MFKKILNWLDNVRRSLCIARTSCYKCIYFEKDWSTRNLGRYCGGKCKKLGCYFNGKMFCAIGRKKEPKK